MTFADDELSNFVNEKDLFPIVYSDASESEHRSLLEVTTENHEEENPDVSQLNNQVCTPNDVKVQVSNVYKLQSSSVCYSNVTIVVVSYFELVCGKIQ